MNRLFLIPFLSALVLSLTGCLGSTPPPPTPLKVSGKVLDASGAPQPGLPVLLGDIPTTTDATGGFSGSLPAPYRLVVVIPTRNDPARREALVYQGVRRADPIVVVEAKAQRSAPLTVNFSGSVGPGGTSAGVMAFNGWTSATIDPATTYSRNWSWFGQPTFTASLCFLRMGNFDAPKFTGFGYLSSATVQDGQAVSYGVTLSPVQTANLSGGVSVAAGYTLQQVNGGFNCVNDGGPVISQDSRGLASFSVPVPVLPVALWVSATAIKGDAFIRLTHMGVSPASSIALSVPSAPEFLSPADKAVGLTLASEFSWLPFAGGLNTASFVPSSPGGLAYTIATTGGSTTLPDLSAVGFPLPKGAAYTWRVFGQAPVATVDAWLSGQPFDYISDYSVASSGQRQFTTAP